MFELVEKVWGSELILWNRLFCVKLLIVKPGGSSSSHFHPKKDEVFIGLIGKPWVRVAYSRTRLLKFGRMVRVKPGVVHQFEGEEDGIILELSTKDDPKDVVRLSASSSTVA